MASAAPGDRKVLIAPSSGAITFSPNLPTDIAFSVLDDSGGPSFALVAAPAKASQLYMQNRQIGDWYAEFTAGGRMASAVAPAAIDAARLAAAKL